MSLIHAAAVLDADAPDYVVQLQAGTHALTGDEAPREGRDRGPAPYEFVLAGLAQCTAATLRMYMQRKTWPATRIDVRTELHADRDGTQYVRRVVTLDARSMKRNASAWPKSASRSRSSSSAARGSTRR